MTGVGDLRLDWHDLDAAGRASRAFLLSMASDPARLRATIDAVMASPSLLSATWHTAGFGEMVLHDGHNAGFVLALWIRTISSHSDPHCHAFSYSSVSLYGEYRQTWHVDSAEIMTRWERPGSVYTIGRSLSHAVENDGLLVALALREPVENPGRETAVATGNTAFQYLRSAFATTELAPAQETRS